VKRLTREQIQARKDKAVAFVRDVVGDPERADEIARESLEDYAARRKFEVVNPLRRPTMARKTLDDYRDEVADLKDQLADLEDENETLQDQLDEIREILAPEQEEAESEEEAE
jgi:predicted RNase H-like nuclease (RuvC/YqgF family)